MQTGWIEDSKGKWYYYDPSSGESKTGWIQDTSGKWYYLNADRTLQTGWMQDGNEWYYFNSNGEMVTDQFVWGFAQGWRYLDSSGEMVTDKWLKINNIVYHSDSSGEITADNSNPNPPTAYDFLGNSISTIATIAQTAKVISVKCLNTGIKASLAELGIIGDFFSCVGPALTIVSLISDDLTYTNQQELSELHDVDLAACAVTIVATIAITATGPLVIAGLAIGAVAYVAKEKIIESYN